MPFIGNKVADVAVTVGQGVIDASHIQDASITTADIGNDAITPNKVDDDGTGFQMGSLGLGTAVSGSEKLTVGGTASFSGDITGTLATAAQTNITSVGTLSSLTLGGDLTLPQKIVHSGDTDTYLSFGTDSFSLYTGGTNVVEFQYGNIYIKQNNKALTGYTTGGGAKELIKIDSSDVVQIGEGQDVSITGDGARFYVKSADEELISIGRAGSSGSALDQGYIRMKSGGTNKIAFHTAGDSYITGGNLSIGSADPLGYGLNIESSNALRIKGANSSSNYHIRALDSASNVDFVVRGDGRIGIGTDSPGYLTELRVNDTVVNTPRLVIRQIGTGDSSLAFQLPDSPYGWVMGGDNSDSERFKISTGVGDLDSSPRFEIDPGGTTIHRYTGAENTVQIHSGTGSSTTGVSQIYFSSKDQYGGNTHQSYIKSTIDGSSSTPATKMSFHNRDSGGTLQEYLTIGANGIATFSKNIITTTESNHTFTASGTDNLALRRQVWYSSYSSHNFQLSTTDSGTTKYLILSTIGSNGHIDWKITGNRMSQVYASITFHNYADATSRTCYLEWSDDEGQNWNTVDTHGSWGPGGATVAATINTANGSSQTNGSSSGSSTGSNQIIIRGRFVGSGGNYIGISNVTIKPTASYWTFVPVPRGYYNTVVSGITASTKSVQGTWTKIGRQIFIQAYLTISGKSGGSGNPYIPLPFTPSDVGVPASTVGANIYKNTSISGLVYFGLYGANKQIYANNGSGGYIGHSSWSDGVVGFNLTYNTL